MARVSGFLLLLVGIGLVGCSTQWTAPDPPQPRSYSATYDQTHRTVGKLRRLLILPANVRIRDCSESPSGSEMSAALTAAIGPYLVDWKGYETVAFKPNGEALDEIVANLGAWQFKSYDDSVPPESEREKLLKISGEADVDGVVIVFGEIECLTAIDILLYFAIVGMPNWFYKLFNENLSAGVYAASDGRLIWSSQVNVLPPSVGGGSYPVNWASSLFSPIENAVPKVLLKEE